jgi:thermitase
LPQLRRRVVAPLVAALLAGMLVPPVASAQPSASGSVRLVITVRRDVSPQTADRIAREGGRVVGRIDQLGVRVVEPPAAASATVATHLAADPRVVRVEPDGLVSIDWTPNDELWSSQWEHRRTRLDRAWKFGRGERTTVIAVVDTGVWARHPDLKGHTLNGWDFVNHDRRPFDDNGHGTAVAGVAAAISNNGIGVAGVCGRCRIMPVKVLESNGVGWWTVAARGIVYAADHGADVINLSFTGPSGTDALGSAIAYARERGVVVVAAAGNQGSTAPGYPAAYPGVISVAASMSTDERYAWSNYSTWVKLAAPGCTTTTHVDGSYGGFCGTSAATPVVSGVAALVISRKPGKDRAWVEDLLRRSTPGTIGSYTKFGRLDAHWAMYRAVHGTMPTVRELMPEPPTFDPARLLSIERGTHTGYRFDNSGAILGWREVTWTEPGTPETTAERAVQWQSGTWYYVVNGRMAGYWLAEGDGITLQPPGDG